MEASPEISRIFSFRGASYRLVMDKDVRESDLRQGRLTVACPRTGERVVVDARVILGDLAQGYHPVAPPYSLRILMEEVLAAGFDDQWLAVILDWTRRLHMLELSRQES
ncbi:MAG TPA: hypothetical protein PKA37_16795 [Planctomycetota bacterium]|jgi:hypothetical protein|nr:hypothetical protein [Planctomycetota bacterium]